MGYNLYFGNLTIKTEDNESWFEVEEITNDNAPSLGHGDVSYNSNGRHPTYTSFHNFLKRTNLLDLFEQMRDGVTSVIPINNYWSSRFDIAIKDYENKFLNLKCPSTVKETQCRDKEGRINHFLTKNCCGLTNEDWDYGKLRWYKFWIDWSLENCLIPTFQYG